VTIPAETTSTAVLPENAVLATASDNASGWRLLAACGASGRRAPGQDDCFERSGKSFKVLTRHLSHFALWQRRAKLTVSLAVTRRVPLYSRRFVTTRITLSRPARATLSLRTRGGRVIRSRTAILPSGTSTVYLAGIPAHPFPRSGRYVLLLQITADGQTTSLRRTITLIRTRSPKRR